MRYGTCTLALCFFLLALPLAGRPYFLSPDGSDKNPGTHLKPWQTLAHAGKRLRPGDQLFLLDGEYSGTLSLSPPQSDHFLGQQFLQIAAIHPGKVTLLPQAGQPAIRIRQGWQIEIAGLTLSGRNGGHWLEIRDSGRIVFRYMQMTAPGPASSVLSGVHSANFVMCRMENTGTGSPVLHTRNCSGLFWYYCTFSGLRQGVKLEGEGGENMFLRCLFTNTLPIPSVGKIPPSGLVLQQCCWRNAMPDPALWNHPEILFRRCILHSGGWPVGNQFRAYAVHNTIFSRAPVAEQPPNSVNNLFLTSRKNLRSTFPVPHLRRGHSAIDQGKAVARVRQSVQSATALVVDHARFFAGRGLTLPQEPDTIWIGETRLPARVLSVDVEKNLLLLDREVEAEQGMIITFPAHGKAPDPGCCEMGLLSIPHPPGAPVRFPAQLRLGPVTRAAEDLFFRPPPRF